MGPIAFNSSLSVKVISEPSMSAGLGSEWLKELRCLCSETEQNLKLVRKAGFTASKVGSLLYLLMEWVMWKACRQAKLATLVLGTPGGWTDSEGS